MDAGIYNGQGVVHPMFTKRIMIMALRESAFCVVEESNEQTECTKNRFGDRTLEACKNNRTDIIIPDYTNVDINIKNDNIHLYHSTINRKMSYTPSFICLHGHSHKFLYNVNGNRINVNIPSLSNVSLINIMFLSPNIDYVP